MLLQLDLHKLKIQNNKKKKFFKKRTEKRKIKRVSKLGCLEFIPFPIPLFPVHILAVVVMQAQADSGPWYSDCNIIVKSI